MKEEKPYIEILRGQLKGAELSLEDARQNMADATAAYQGAADYYNECKERYENMLNDLNQNTNDRHSKNTTV